ncbi:23S rRNA (pseudouridine(1915)-N(3))-methyltransferase RlmH, partial [uncultured Senegalimassilia sp.]|uniref:23S rRNA (pseudouridine(1915)-N(3))-methyltransferase RlmH n=1 Tax=uncultured Senegalimassilia sp. TaxID=1714350 RepID=UPI0025FB1552
TKPFPTRLKKDRSGFVKRRGCRNPVGAGTRHCVRFGYRQSNPLPYGFRRETQRFAIAVVLYNIMLRYERVRMKFTVVAVGKLKERFWVDACAEYLKRLQPYAKTQVREIADVDPRKVGGVEGARDKEGAAICAELEKLGADTHVVLLAIDGKERSSEGLSKRLDNLMLQGKSNFAFVIGGSDGVSDEVRKRANEFLSFGPITLPHNLARVVLLEQLYRSQKISHGEPYHK